MKVLPTLSHEIELDYFAGGGGASEGIEAALGRGRRVAVAINHDADAIRMHKANHKRTLHLQKNVREVRIREVIGDNQVGLAWFSPDCRHFSRAKGGKPVEKQIRGLAWEAIRCAVEAKPRVIILENVREFEDWGPLVPRWVCLNCEWKGTEGQATLLRRGRKCPRCESRRLSEVRCKKTGMPEMIPDPARKGLTFRRFVGRLRNLGYAIGHKVLNAADYGAPTHRRRLFLVARNDGKPIVWPTPTHTAPEKVAAAATGLFPATLQPWRTAAECIDWSIPCPSIFLGADEAKSWGEANNCRPPQRPLREQTLRRIALGVKRYVLDNPKPFIVGVGGRAGQSPPTRLDSPLNTITAKGDKAFVCATIARLGQTGGNGGYVSDIDNPLSTITSKAEHLLIASTIVNVAHGDKGPPENRSSGLDAPVTTIHAGGGNQALVTAFLAKHFGGMVGVPAISPLPTTTARGTQTQIVTANLIHFNHGDKQWSHPEEPLRTITTGNHAFLVYSFLTKYFGNGGPGQSLIDPLHTITHKDRFGLVTVTIDGETYVIVDIGMRMLTPRELALCQGFPGSYVLTGTKTSQVARIGNSVPPQLAEAMVRANYRRRRVGRTAAA